MAWRSPNFQSIKVVDNVYSRVKVSYYKYQFCQIFNSIAALSILLPWRRLVPDICSWLSYDLVVEIEEMNFKRLHFRVETVFGKLHGLHVGICIIFDVHMRVLRNAYIVFRLYDFTKQGIQIWTYAWIRLSKKYIKFQKSYSSSKENPIFCF